MTAHRALRKQQEWECTSKLQFCWGAKLVQHSVRLISLFLCKGELCSSLKKKRKTLHKLLAEIIICNFSCTQWTLSFWFSLISQSIAISCSRGISSYPTMLTLLWQFSSFHRFYAFWLILQFRWFLSLSSFLLPAPSFFQMCSTAVCFLFAHLILWLMYQ